MGNQGQQKDDEIYGKGNAYAFKYRMQDARINRFMTTDPLHAKYPYNSDYAFAENSFVCGIDLEGLELLPVNTGMFRMGVNEGGNKIITLNYKNVLADFKNNGTPLFTPASVGITPQGQVMLTNTPSLNPAHGLVKNPDWPWKEPGASRDGDGGYIGTNLGRNQVFADQANALGSARQEVSAWWETFTSYMPTWNAHADLKDNIRAFDQAVKAVEGAPMTLGFSNATNSKLQADVTNFVYDGSLPVMNYNRPESSLDYSSKVVGIGMKILNDNQMPIRNESKTLTQRLDNLRKNWDGKDSK